MQYLFFVAFSSAMTKKTNTASILLVLGLLIATVNISGAQSVGVCYGRNGNNLPSEAQVIELYKSNGIGRMRIYEPNQPTLEALKGSNIELMVTILNPILPSLADAPTATEWVQKNIKDYSPDVKFRYIAVGNELHPGDAETKYLLPAIQNIQSAITAANLQDQIKVSTAIDTKILENTYPPSNGAFIATASEFMNPVVSFLAQNGSPLLANIYPYFGYNKDPQQIPYALFTSPGVVTRDPNNNLEYQNLFDALLDSLYAALEKAGAPNLQVVVSESGWPSAGDNEATVENAGTYYKNLISHVKNGSPKKKEAIEAYLFAMFDENVKDGDEVEKHFGLFSADSQPKYQLSFN